MTTSPYEYTGEEYPPHSHQPHPEHAETCQVCGALIMSSKDEDCD